MARYYLLTRARTASGPLFPGTLLDDAQDPVAAIVGSGARTSPAPDAVLAAAALRCEELRLRGGSAEQAEALMLEASARSLAQGGGGAFVQSQSAVLAADFSDGTETWATVVSVSITTGASKLQVFASATVDDQTSQTLSHLARVSVDGVPVPGARSRFVVAGSFTQVNLAAEVAVAAGAHLVALELKSGGSGSILVSLAASQPENEGASLIVNEVV